MIDRRLYKELRGYGWTAKDAYHTAKIQHEFDSLGDKCVRIQAQPEEENYFDVYGESDGYTDLFGRRVSATEASLEIIHNIESDGCWYVASEYFDNARRDWFCVESIGMIIGDPTSHRDNIYLAELMESAITAYKGQSFWANI